MKALAHKTIESRYRKLSPDLTEKSRRHWAGVEAMEIGYGGISAVSRATGLTHVTIRKGIKEITERGENPGSIKEGAANRQRKLGAGRKKLTDKNPRLHQDAGKAA